ncbi:hypothetical protein B0H13DRAFT_1992542, partial [Mycena leptocephala]
NASADRSDSPDDREKDDGRGGNKKSAASKAKDLSHVPCKFYKVGSCTAGSSCPFSHSMVEPGGQKDVCAWFVKGNCKFGHKCALAHQARRREQLRNPLLAGGSTAPTRARPPMNMPLKATISPSAPAPPLKDTDFASFGVLDESSQLPTAPARNKSPSPTTTKPRPRLSPSPPHAVRVSAPQQGFWPIGSPPSSATSPSSRMHSGTPPTQANGFLSTSPFSAPGQSVFRGYGDSGRTGMGMAASLGSGIAMGGGPGGWNANSNGVSSSPMRAMNGRSVNGEYDISVEYEEFGTKTRRKATMEDSNEDLEDFLPSSLTDLLTPRAEPAHSPGVGGFESSSPHRHGLGVPLGTGAGGGGGHRYSRSVPAPSLLGGDLKSIWADQGGAPPSNPHAHPQASGLPGSPMGLGHPSSYSSASGFGGREFDGAPSSFAERTLPSLSPSNASAAFLPNIHHYIAQNKQQGARTTSNPANGLFASNAAAQQGPPGIAHYLQSGPGGPSGVHHAMNANAAANANSPYVRPNPFDLTQQPHHGQAPPPALGGPRRGYSRIHALPPLPPTAGSPSPAAFGTSPTPGRLDWANMSPGSVSGSPGFMSFMSSTKPAPAPAPAAQAAPKNVTMFSQRLYSAAARTGAPSAAPMQRNPSGGAKSQGGAPMSPLGGPVVTADDDLFPLDE